MSLPLLLRQARQMAGLSQRALAAASGVPKSTVGDAESGVGTPSWTVVQRLVEACGLRLALEVPWEHSPVELLDLQAHLSLSTWSRLDLLLGGSGAPTAPSPGSAALRRVTYGRQLVLQPRQSLGIWLPGFRIDLPLVVDQLGPPGWPCRDIAESDAASVIIERTISDRPAGCVPIALDPSHFLLVPSPLALALTIEGGAQAGALRAVSALLDGAARSDDGGRHGPAHRQADEATEATHLMRSLTFAGLDSARLPDWRDSRGWRLDQPVSLRQWLLEHRLPPRRRSARGWEPPSTR